MSKIERFMSSGNDAVVQSHLWRMKNVRNLKLALLHESSKVRLLALQRLMSLHPEELKKEPELVYASSILGKSRKQLLAQDTIVLANLAARELTERRKKILEQQK
ncbi:MAG TPA: hypothetical protein VGQ00_04665 [Candidatus Norongarragalinales archaeon]|jgi:hypothetical protein|nr:hypothetical protein [Candidatus Norongarragalinales archaeon]